MDLVNELQVKINQLGASLKELRKSGTNYAKAERDYKILLRQECLKLRDDGMAIGMIDKTCYGIPSVAQTIYQANLEAINTLKLQLRLIENQISREFGSSN